MPNMARGAQSRKVWTIYPQPEQGEAANDTADLFLRLKSLKFPLQYPLSMKGRVSLVKEDHAVIYRIMDLPWRPPGIAYSGPAKAPSRQDILWLPKSSPLEDIHVPFSVPDADKSVSFSDFDELWVDYQNFFPQDSCSFSTLMSMTADGEEGRSHFIAAGGEYALKAVQAMDVAAASWLEKDPFYLLRRKLGLAPDGNWRIAQWGKFVVFQKRFHQDLSGIEALDLVFQSGANVEGVSLRLTARDDYGPGQLVELGKIAPIASDIPGREIIRINVSDVLRQRFPKIEQVYLQEMIVILPGERWKMSAARPFKSLVFQTLQLPGLANQGKSRLQVLPEHSESIAPDLNRLVVDLRPLSEKGDVRLKDGIITISSKGQKNRCGVRLEKVRLVGLYKAPWPSFLLSGEDRRWGGPFLPALQAEKYVEWPKIESYLPLDMFVPQRPRLSKGSGSSNIEIPGSAAQSQANAVRAQEATIRSDSSLRISTVAQQGLPLEGRGKWIEIHWPISTEIARDTYFFLGIAKGAEYISKGVLTLEFNSGQVVSMGIVPNEPLSLGYGDKKVRKAKLRLELMKSPFSLNLSELVLFRPVNLTPEQAFNENRPVYAVEKLVVTNAAASPNLLFETSVGHLRGVLFATEDQGQTLRWSTKLADRMDWVSGIRLAYHLPVAVAARNPCWLNLAVQWEKGRVNREICVQQPAGELVIPFSYFMEHDSDSRALGTLRSIDWQVHFGRINPGTEHVGAFYFDFSAEGTAMRSVRQELQAWPLLDVGGEKVPFSFSDNKLSMDEIVRRPIWLNLGQDVLKRIIEQDGLVTPLAYPHFKVDSMVLESNSSALNAVLEELRAEDKSTAKNSYWRYLLIGLMILAAICIALSIRAKESYLRGRISIARNIIARLWAAGPIFWGIFWVFMAAALYALGAFIPVGMPELAAVLALGAGMRAAMPLLKRRHIIFISHFYEKPGAYYFVLGFAMIIATACLLFFKGFTPVTNSVSFLAFYCLALGLSKEIWALRRA